MECPNCGSQLLGVEVKGRYDGISHRECYTIGPLQEGCGKKYSRNGYLEMEDNELCRYGKIYKTKETEPFTFTIISERDDLPPNQD